MRHKYHHRHRHQSKHQDEGEDECNCDDYPAKNAPRSPCPLEASKCFKRDDPQQQNRVSSDQSTVADYLSGDVDEQLRRHESSATEAKQVVVQSAISNDQRSSNYCSKFEVIQNCSPSRQSTTTTIEKSSIMLSELRESQNDQSRVSEISQQTNSSGEEDDDDDKDSSGKVFFDFDAVSSNVIQCCRDRSQKAKTNEGPLLHRPDSPLSGSESQSPPPLIKLEQQQEKIPEQVRPPRSQANRGKTKRLKLSQHSMARIKSMRDNITRPKQNKSDKEEELNFCQTELNDSAQLIMGGYCSADDACFHSDDEEDSYHLLYGTTTTTTPAAASAAKTTTTTTISSDNEPDNDIPLHAQQQAGGLQRLGRVENDERHSDETKTQLNQQHHLLLHQFGRKMRQTVTEQHLEQLSNLISIIRNGNFKEFVDLLERQGFKRNLLNVFVNGQTALHYTLLYGRSLAWCKQLVLNGANPNLTNRAGWHPIHLAAYKCSNETTRYLLECLED